MQRNRGIINRMLEAVSKHPEEWISIDDLGKKVIPNSKALMTLALGDIRPEIFGAHVELCLETGWLEKQSNPAGAELSFVVRLTWTGHEAVEVGQNRWP